MKQMLPRGPGEREVVARTIWSPYGEPMEMEWHDGIMAPALPDIFAYLGIRDHGIRRLCCEAMEAARGPTPWGGDGLKLRAVYRIARAHGGGRPPVIGLPLPSRPLAPAIPPVGGMDEAGWDSRHHILLKFLHESRRGGEIGREPARLVRILTGQLESWTEGRIQTLPQSVAYAMSLHPAWRNKAVTFLTPYRTTWLGDYLERAPWIRPLARSASKAVDGVPNWLWTRR